MVFLIRRKVFVGRTIEIVGFEGTLVRRGRVAEAQKVIVATQATVNKADGSAESTKIERRSRKDIRKKRESLEGKEEIRKGNRE